MFHLLGDSTVTYLLDILLTDNTLLCGCFVMTHIFFINFKVLFVA